MHIFMNLMVVQQAAAALNARGSFQSLSCVWVAGEPQQHRPYMAAPEETAGQQQNFAKGIQPFSVSLNIAKSWIDQCKWHFFFFKQFCAKVPGK